MNRRSFLRTAPVATAAGVIAALGRSEPQLYIDGKDFDKAARQSWGGGPISPLPVNVGSPRNMFGRPKYRAQFHEWVIDELPRGG